ncbi:2-oxoglutarate dehydrogenase complex dihydrolipoyllysine-residue succinyltransferase [Saccharibacillus alkalitolerans]|uniref:Dihydrolipoyllysine-residue succinyltransferase component of 2-oxoglutarate dehydrogenase complex n=1 Tax=Saccharibacillus alkalitolerans TaxID=2705290 RepID=A0ABX0F398_9BACL|nr:2-oxoglutarate dehydrogenase complex dihydrolipoyllysine-residue succinyltransferase [Saccharibacillus alkalitolerans]NGZ75406.1 2-oxoglutarate dehydrogenase complex dihydrolipoyllysine-residue succinyltransferase [Saccharibacillus alkalitolerans]
MSDIKVPEMGESVTEGTILRWTVAEGEAVQQGDVLLELETDKVNLEVSAESSGLLETRLRQEGDTVQVGEVIGRIRTGDAASSTTGSASTSLGEERPAAAPEAAAPAASLPQSPKAAEAVSPPPAESGDSAAKASPAARKLARERGVELGSVPSSDPIGRVYSGDVKSFAEGGSAAQSQPASQQPAQSAPQPAASAPKAPAQAPSAGDPLKPVERQRMSRRRQTIATRLVEAQQTAAMLTTFNEVDMTAILDVRKRRKDNFKQKFDVNLGFMSFFTKAVVGALKAFPAVNAEIDGDEVVYKKFYDIGIAVSAKEGLVVPVVRDADRLGFAEIEKSIAGLATKARNNQLALSDLQGGTFTITNGGVFGSLLSTPILNAPQVGILGMHKIQLRPVAIDAERMENRPMMYIALSYDHRIIDGSEAVSFLVKVKELLEDPESLLIES